MIMQARTGDTVLVKSREMTGRTQILTWCLGEGGVKTTEYKIHWPHCPDPNFAFFGSKSNVFNGFLPKPMRNLVFPFFTLTGEEPKPVFVNLLRSPGIDSQPGGTDS
jgi:hypothetical protein